MNNKKIIFYHIISEVHYRNFLIFSNYFSNYEFILIFEKNLNKKIILSKNIYKSYELNKKNFKFFNKINLDLIIFSTTQPRINVFNLLSWALIKNILTITIKETNHFLLHSEKINNYILPTSNLFVISEYEKKIFENLYYDKKKLNVVGWPFLNVSFQKKNTFLEKNNNKKNFLIIFDASNKHNPNNKITYKDFRLITLILYKFFYPKYNIFIKFHPLDENNFFLNMIFLFIKNIKIIKNNDIQNIFPNIDLAVNTGFSQSIIEALLLNKKIFIFTLKKYKKYLNIAFKNIIFTEENINKFSFSNIDNFDYKEIKNNLINY